MTLQTIQSDIAQASREFHGANRRHWRVRVVRGQGTMIDYVQLTPAIEKRIGDLSERLTRLHRFHSILAAKEMLTRLRASDNGSVQIR